MKLARLSQEPVYQKLKALEYRVDDEAEPHGLRTHPCISRVTAWQMRQYLVDLQHEIESRSMGRESYKALKRTDVDTLYREIKQIAKRKYCFSNVQESVRRWRQVA